MFDEYAPGVAGASNWTLTGVDCPPAAAVVDVADIGKSVESVAESVTFAVGEPAFASLTTTNDWAAVFVLIGFDPNGSDVGETERMSPSGVSESATVCAVSFGMSVVMVTLSA
jgi:hypothetical protein